MPEEKEKFWPPRKGFHQPEEEVQEEEDVQVCQQCGTVNRELAFCCKNCRSSYLDSARGILESHELVECPQCEEMTANDGISCDQCGTPLLNDPQ